MKLTKLCIYLGRGKKREKIKCLVVFPSPPPHCHRRMGAEGVGGGGEVVGRGVGGGWGVWFRERGGERGGNFW